ncbi:MAG: hypothetical protein HY686_05590 [Chloroflexi bacterium]|nr:hypothetical protein [Chloroflexota bacterium]
MKARELKEKMWDKEVVLGFQQFTPSPTITEIAGLAGFDWMWLCIEHGGAALGTDLENMIRAANAVDVVPLVRVSDNEHYIIMRSMELGAKGIILPRVKTREDVERAVDAATFGGSRGICPVSRAHWYGAEPLPLRERDEETIVIALIEQKEAVDNLDEILQVKGLDCAFFGSADLSLSLGIWDRVQRRDEEALGILDRCRQRWLAACRRHGVPMGQIPRDPDDAIRLINEGITVLGSSPDTGWFYRFLKGFTTPVKEYARQKARV